jgi:hypothetical protein
LGESDVEEDMRSQPSPELEAENAAYAWAKECIREHADAVRKCAEYPTAEKWDEMAWTFERAQIAFSKHAALEGKRLGRL